MHPTALTVDELADGGDSWQGEPGGKTAEQASGLQVQDKGKIG